MTADNPWQRASPTKRVLLVAAMIALAWGPGIVIGLILYSATGLFYVGVLTFAVITAISSIVLGAIGSIRMRRRETR